MLQRPVGRDPALEKIEHGMDEQAVVFARDRMAGIPDFRMFRMRA